MSRIEQRLKEREEARKAAVAARRLEKEKDSRKEESYQYFSEQVSVQVTAIEQHLEEAKSLPKTELAAHFDDISKEFQSLHKLVSEATLYLAGFELKTTQEQVTQLYVQFNTAKDQLLPKKKFAFKSRPKKPTVSNHSEKNTTPDSQSPAQSLGAVNTPSASLLAEDHQNMTGFSKRENEHLSLSATEIRLCDVNLSLLKNCEIKLLGNPVTLHMTNLDNCCVLCGPVSSSVFVDNCRNCTFVVACQQLRVHTTVDSVFYLHVTSKAIIEDSKQLQFAPYSLTYPQLQAQFQESGLSEVVNNWSDVDDFNWLVPSTPSPNWTIMAAEQRNTWNL